VRVRVNCQTESLPRCALLSRRRPSLSTERECVGAPASRNLLVEPRETVKQAIASDGARRLHMPRPIAQLVQPQLFHHLFTIHSLREVCLVCKHCGDAHTQRYFLKSFEKNATGGGWGNEENGRTKEDGVLHLTIGDDAKELCAGFFDALTIRAVDDKYERLCASVARLCTRQMSRARVEQISKRAVVQDGYVCVCVCESEKVCEERDARKVMPPKWPNLVLASDVLWIGRGVSRDARQRRGGGTKKSDCGKQKGGKGKKKEAHSSCQQSRALT